MGDPKDILSALVRVLDGGSVRYAMIGGMAAQVWRRQAHPEARDALSDEERGALEREP